MKLVYLLACMATFLLSSCSHDYVRPENYQNPQVRIDTELGSMTFELFEDKVPNATSHFLQLTEDGFYKEMFFHRIVSGTLAQGGCPYTRPEEQGRIGTGGPGYSIEEEYHPELRHNEKGILSLARGHDAATTGSQFLILFEKMPFMDDNTTMIGKIIEGREVLDLIAAAGSRTGKVKRQILFSIKVLRKNDVDYKIQKIEK